MTSAPRTSSPGNPSRPIREDQRRLTQRPVSEEPSATAWPRTRAGSLGLENEKSACGSPTSERHRERLLGEIPSGTRTEITNLLLPARTTTPVDTDNHATLDLGELSTTGYPGPSIHPRTRPASSTSALDLRLGGDGPDADVTAEVRLLVRNSPLHANWHPEPTGDFIAWAAPASRTLRPTDSLDALDEAEGCLTRWKAEPLFAAYVVAAAFAVGGCYY